MPCDGPADVLADHSLTTPSVLPPASPSPPQPLRHKWVGPVPPVDHRALAQVQQECPVCHGTGKIIHRHCHKCGGDKERRRRVPPRPPLPARAGALLCTSGSSCEDGRIGAIRSCRRPREHATDGPGLEAALSTRGVASVTGSVLAAQRACLVADRARPRSESHSRVAVRLFAAPL